MPSRTNAFGQSQHFSFGQAAASTGSDIKDAKEPQPGQEHAPAETGAAPAPANFAALPAFLGTGGKPVDTDSGGQPNLAAKPFTLSFGAGGLPSLGAKEPQQDDRKQKADAPVSNGAAAGLPLAEVRHALLFSSCRKAVQMR